VTFVRTGMRLGHRRAVVGIAVFAAIICGLGSSVMQELAYSQRANYDAQVAFANRAGAACTGARADDAGPCRARHGVPDPSGLRLYAYETDTLGSRARTLQTAGGALHWAQAWLVTLLGLAALLVGVAVTTAADVEARRLVPGWHPARANRGPLLVTGVAGASAATVVSLGAAGGSAIAAVAGSILWPLSSEPRHIALEALGPVASPHPSVGWLLAWISVVVVVVLVSWWAQRTLVAILSGGMLFAVSALLSDLLPAWFPWATLPSASGTWLHHRGEIVDVWRWPVTPLVRGTPAVDWTAIAAHDPRIAALIGCTIALAVAALALPWAARRTLD
jgi:hypothetical protein